MECHTINDVIDLLSEYKVELIRKDNKIFFEFPDDEELDGKIGHGPTNEDIEKVNKYIEESPEKLDGNSEPHLKYRARYVVRSLISSGRFWRLTTVADHLGSYARWHCEFGKAKTTKKRDEPFTIHFDSDENAIKFYNKCIK